QRDLIDFVQGVNQAVQLSGVTAQEAQAAMIQFSQGLAKGRLDGDELRSVLEQIPFVADVISRKLEANRYELKELGKEGKIIPQDVIEQFQDICRELTILFAPLRSTLSQVWAVIRNEIMQSIVPIPDQIGSGLVPVLATIADNMDLVSASVGIA